MRERFLDLLACPRCGGGLAFADVRERSGDAVVEGSLRCGKCDERYPIEKRVPVFVPRENYADNFGWQWKQFHELQRDSYNGTRLVRDTILRRSGWKESDLAGKSILECGCGSGNDTEVLSELAGTLVSMDFSAAVEAVPESTRARPNVLAVRGDLRQAPLRPGTFDIVYCHRVIQHTPDPRASFDSMSRYVKPGGLFFLHSYDTHWKSVLHFRYWLRPLIRRMPHERVRRMLEVAGPVLYPVAGALNRVALLRRPTKLLVPFENHDRILQKAGARLTPRERYEYSFLVTFDALTPRHDHPSSPSTVAGWFRESGFVDVDIRSRNPVIAIGRRPA